MKPYDHQSECLDLINSERRLGKTDAFVVMACGLGKTALVAFDAKWYMNNPNQKLLYLCHQNETLKQARDTFKRITKEPDASFGLFNGIEKNIRAKYLFASFQTMRENLNRFDKNEFDYLVVDEAHHAPAETFRPIIEYFEPKFKIGLTATPQRMDLKNVLDLFGNKSTYELNIEKALALGLLPKIDYRLIDLEVEDLEALNDYRLTMAELDKRIFRPKRDEKIVEIITEKIQEIKNPRTMVFCGSIKHAELLSLLMPDSLAVHSKMSNKEQIRRTDLFKQGAIKTIFTIDQFNEGIDVPEVNVEVFLRSTASPVIFYQQLGRGARPYPNKDKLLILDFVANCQRVEMIREFIDKVANLKEKNPNSRYGRGRNLTKIDDDIIIDFGKFNFYETSKNISEVLRRLRTGYTKEELIEQLQFLAKHLNRTPTATDISDSARIGLTVGYSIFAKTFGTVNAARRAASLELNVQKHDSATTQSIKEKMIKQLQLLATIIGVTPDFRDIVKYSQKEHGRLVPSIASFSKYFGGLNKARKAAGFQESDADQHHKLPKTYLLKKLWEVTKKLGHMPSIPELTRESRNLYPGVGAYRGAFGGLGKAKKVLENELNNHSVKKYIDYLQNLYNKDERLDRNKAPDSKAPKRVLKTPILVNVLEKTDLEERVFIDDRLKNNMLLSLIQLWKNLGRKPDPSDVSSAAEEGKIIIPNYEAYKVIFGGLDIALSLIKTDKDFS